MALYVAVLHLLYSSYLWCLWCIVYKVVTEDEIALAMMEGDVVTMPPDSALNQLSTNGLPEAETENDPLNYNMEETK